MIKIKKDSCESCAVCCKLFLINLSEKEFYSGMFQTELVTDEHFNDFATIEEYGLNILKKKTDDSCVYLKDCRCSIYNNRPQVCRDFFCGSDKPEFEGMAEEIAKFKQTDQKV